MAEFSGYIRLQNDTHQLYWNSIDNQGVVEDTNQFLGWNDWTEFQLIFYVNPPSVPVTPPPSTGGPGGTISVKRANYFKADRTRVFVSDRSRIFLA